MYKNSLLLLAGLFALLATAAPPSAHTYLGPSVAIGHGSARTFVQADAHNRPVAFGFQFTSTAMNGLPARPGSDTSLDWHYNLFFPAAAPATGFKFVMVNWHPLGHAPQGIYTVPHFDFHLYVISPSAQMAIRYPHPESNNMTGVTMPAHSLVPAGYIIPPGTEVNEMGLHAIPASAPELHGHPFTNTLIYGYDTHGALVFLEPMISMSYLVGRPSYSAAVPQPAAYSYAGYYPGRYSVSYDSHTRVYTVTYSQLRAWHASQIASEH